jgi:hypothetical protein
MTTDTVETALQKLLDLGVDPDDYYSIPIQDAQIDKIEKEFPKRSKLVTKHYIIVDSRQRNYSLYPNPNNYFIELFESFHSVERLELTAAMLPKTEYNINSENNLLIVTVGGVTKQLFLTPGQYLIGSNVYGSPDYLSNGDNSTLWGLIGELKRILNQAFSDFDVFLATVPSPEGTGSNASVLNRVVITNSSSDFIIDFTNNNYTNIAATGQDNGLNYHYWYPVPIPTGTNSLVTGITTSQVDAVATPYSFNNSDNTAALVQERMILIHNDFILIYLSSVRCILF